MCLDAHGGLGLSAFAQVRQAVLLSPLRWRPGRPSRLKSGWPMPWPSAAASRSGVQIQGFHPTVRGLPGASEWPKGHCSGLCLNRAAGTR